MGTFSTKSRNAEVCSTLRLGFDELLADQDAPEPPQLLSLLASVLEKTVHKNEKFLKRSRTKDGVTIFHGSRPPALSIRQYIERIFKYSNCSPSCFVVAYIYMDRFLQGTSSYLTSLNAHRLLISCVLLAVKFLDDVGFNNAYYAKVGGVSTAEMNKLELKLLFSLNFKLHVTLQTFDEYCQLLETEGSRIANRSNWQIERALQGCGLRGVWMNKEEPKCSSTSKFASYSTCRAI